MVSEVLQIFDGFLDTFEPNGRSIMIFLASKGQKIDGEEKRLPILGIDPKIASMMDLPAQSVLSTSAAR